MKRINKQSKEVMLNKFELMAVAALVMATFVGSEAAAEDGYSCYFPVKCDAPDGDCGLASLRKDFSSSDASSYLELDGNRIFIFPDLSSIYVQENGKSAVVYFLNDAVSSVETAHGVCQSGS